MVALKSLLLISALSGVGETVMLEFTSGNCPACVTMEPTLRKLKAQGFPIRQINVGRSPQWATHYRIRAVPCFVMIANGQVVDRVEGSTSQQRLLTMFATAGVRPLSQVDGQVRAQSPDQRRGGFQLPNFLPRAKTENVEKDKPVATLAERETPPTATKSNESSQVSEGRVGNQVEKSPERRALAATVRLKVEDPNGYSFGTGTVIHIHDDEALVLTCGHIFRDSGGKGRITVDVSVGGTPRSIPGQLISYEADTTDVGLVSIRPGAEITAIPVAPGGYRSATGTKVFTVGCNNGRPPSLERSQIKSINRYTGPPNIEVAGMPVNGRSGGGLFTYDGYLIGVCNAADQQDDEGIYAALGTVHQALAKIGQSRIFEQKSPPTRLDGSNVATNASSPSAVKTTNPIPAKGVAATTTNEEDVEVICVVRSPDGQTITYVLNGASADRLKSQLIEESRPHVAKGERFPRTPYRSGTVLRGQSPADLK